MTRRVPLLVVCGDGDVDPRRIAQAARQQGCTLVFALTDAPHARELAPAMQALGTVVEAADLDELRRYDFGGIVTFSDALGTTAELAAQLDLPFLDRATLRVLTDKNAQRDVLRDVGVSLMTSPRQRPANAGRSSRVYADDDRCTVICVADGERAVPLAVMGTLVDAVSGAECGGYSLAPAEQVIEPAERAAGALGIRHGMVSVELVRVEGDWRVIEVNGGQGVWSGGLATAEACDPVAVAVGAALGRGVPPLPPTRGEPHVSQLHIELHGSGACATGRVQPHEPLDEALARVLAPPAPSAGTITPRSDAERAVAEVFASLLRHDQFGVDDSLFELGGTTLTAVRAAQHLRAAVGADVDVADVLAFPSVSALARVVSSGSGSRLPALVLRPRPRFMPLSSSQARLWFLHELDGPTDAYNVPLVWRVDGSVAADALSAAIVDVVDRHESLRTSFGAVDGRPFQRVVDTESLPSLLTVRDLAEPDLHAAVDAACRTQLDLAAGLPLHSWLFQTGHSATFVLLVHHIAVDGHSLGPLLRDLSQAYAARSAGRRPEWVDLLVQYADYTLWQQETLGAGTVGRHPLLQADLDFWTSELADASPGSGLPTDHPRLRDEADRPVGLATFEIGADVHLALLKLARECRTTVFVTLHAAVTVLLRERGAHSHVQVGVPIAGRDSPELDELVGMFVNTVLLRADASGEPTFRELVTQLARRDGVALAHGRVPFDQVVGLLHHRRPGGPGPGFQVMLGLEQATTARLVLPGARCTPVSTDIGTAKCDLDITFVSPPPPVTSRSAGLSGTIRYDLSVFEHATGEGLAARLVELLDGCVARPDEPCFAAGPSEPLDEQTVEVMGELFAATLNRPEGDIGLDDDFFGLGGDRLAAARLVNQLRVALDVDVELSDLERMPTIAALAAWLGSAAEHGSP